MRKKTWELDIRPVFLLLTLILLFFPLLTRGVSEWSSTINVNSSQRNSRNSLEEVRMFAYISELLTWSVGPSRYGVTEVDVSFNFTMYNRMDDPQIFTWGNLCEFSPSGTGILEVENLTFQPCYVCAEALIPITYSPGPTHRNRTYGFCLSDPVYTELPSGSYRFDIFNPAYHSPSFPTFGVTLIINETGSFRIYDEIPSSLFSHLSETPSNTPLPALQLLDASTILIFVVMLLIVNRRQRRI